MINNETTIVLKEDANINEIINKINLHPNTKIKIKRIKNLDEIKYNDMLKKIFEQISSVEKEYYIEIEVENREIIKKSGLLNYHNINMHIYTDNTEYTLSEFLEEETQLENLIKPIKSSNLSPYEKYLAVYNIVKQFKPYKENENDKSQSRKIKYILKNEYMVCVGYATLLKTLLDKIDIPAICISVSYEQESTKENKITVLEGHERNIVKIDDEKYNIHGIFVADATWDNDMKQDLYNNSSMTFDRKKEARKLESLTPTDLLLDFHNIGDFSKKINFYLKRYISKSSEEKYILKAIKGYQQLYLDIMNHLRTLDYDKYNYFYTEYHNKIEKILSCIFPKQEKTSSNFSDSMDNILYLLSQFDAYSDDSKANDKIDSNLIKEAENLFSDFLTEYATYIIPISNKAIPNQIIFEAAMNVKKEINKYTLEQLNMWKKEAMSINHEEEIHAFPYSYDPNITRLNYLNSETNISHKNR